MSTKEHKHRANSKNYMLRVRLDDETLKQLDTCAEVKNTSRSEIVREGIEKVSNEINKK